jgi:cysteinyl-tRNA synthetase
MSKSLGNFFSVREVADKFGYEPIRYFMLASHYRSPVNYSVDSIEQAKAALQRLYTCRDNLDFALQSAEETGTALDVAQYRDGFIEAMDDDFNTGGAIGSVFELVREINTGMQGASRQSLLNAAALFDELTGVLGLVYNRKQAETSNEAEDLIAEREQARADKNWARADEIRTQLKEMGVTIEDTPNGTKIVK